MNEVRIAVVSGGVSEERAVSLSTGREVAEALRENFEVDHIEIDTTALPIELDPNFHVVFPALHGGYGEGGGIQRQLETGGFAYAGSGPEASRLCLNKYETKAVVAALGVRTAPDVVARAPDFPEATEIVELLGDEIVAKPNSQGSSVGLTLVDGIDELKGLLPILTTDTWLLEKKISGREITVGVLQGEPMGLVEIKPIGGAYDYRHKYTGGMTTYEYPAKVDEAIAEEIRDSARRSFAKCGCRDFARIDFILSEDDEYYFLEINTLPGLTATSLLPMSAACLGHDFPYLAMQMVLPAVERFKRRQAQLVS